MIQQEAPQQDRSYLSMAKGLNSSTIILTYHDLVPRRDSSSVWFDCTPGELTSQLDTLAAWGAQFISLDQLWLGLTGQKLLPAQAVVITFADNYQGFYDHAWPILKERRVPVTLFVHTGHVGSRKGRPKMSWAALRELQSSGLVSVQSQTVSHSMDISRLSPKQMDKEFAYSKSHIEENLGTECWAVAYPNGRFSPEVAAAASKAGLVMGFTEEQRTAESAEDILLVPRWVHTKWKEAWRSARTSEDKRRR